jgi:outer membrane protein assembly factor BamA
MRDVLSTGLLAQANVEVMAEGSGVVLRVNVLPRRVIATVRVTGGVIDMADMLDAVGARVGAEITAPILPTLEARAIRFYAQRGYPWAKVHAEAVDTDAPDKVVLSLDIVPNVARRVAERVFVIEPRIDEEVGELKNQYRVGRHDRTDERALTDADRDLADVLRDHGFVRAAVRHSVRDQGPLSYLYVYVDAGPRLVPTFDGNHAFDSAELAVALNLEKSPESRSEELADRLRAYYVARGFLDVEVSVSEKVGASPAVHYLVFAIREHARVRVVSREFPCLASRQLSPDEVEHEIGSYLEDELPGGEPVAPIDVRQLSTILGSAQFVGGRAAPTDLNPLTTYAPDTYDSALAHIRDLLHSRGYANAVVGPVSLVRATCSKLSRPGQCQELPLPKRPEPQCTGDAYSVPVPEPPLPSAFTCRPDPAHDVECSPDVRVRIPIALGPRTTLYDLAFEGNHFLPSAALAKEAKLELGEPLSNVVLEAARLRVLDVYHRQGFAFAEVRTQTEPSPDRTRARVRIYVAERERVIVSGFVVKGATRTSERLILRRVALKKNAPYRSEQVRQTEERIATLGTFSSVSVGLEDADVPERQKRVVISVVEQDPQWIEDQPGLSTGEGLRNLFEWGHRNIAGLAISATLRVRLSYLPDALIFDPTVVSAYDRLSLLDRMARRDNISLNFPEVGLGPTVNLTLDAIDLRDNQRDYTIEKQALVPTLVYRPFRQLTTRAGVSAEHNDVNILTTNLDEGTTAASAVADTLTLLRAPQGETVALAERLEFALDTRDVPLNATRGVFFATGVEHVDSFPVATPINAADVTRTNRSTITSHVLRFTGKVATYVRLSQKGAALAVSLGAGYVQSLAPRPVSSNLPSLQTDTYPDRLFFLGGVDSLRAFLADSLIPEDAAQLILKKTINPRTGRPVSTTDIPVRGGNVAINPKVELRVPLVNLFSLGVFLDTGNLWVDPQQVTPWVLRYCLGAGVRVNTPIGPLAFDYGWNLAYRWWEDSGAFHFSIGVP